MRTLQSLIGESTTKTMFDQAIKGDQNIGSFLSSLV